MRCLAVEPQIWRATFTLEDLIGSDAQILMFRLSASAAEELRAITANSLRYVCSATSLVHSLGSRWHNVLQRTTSLTHCGTNNDTKRLNIRNLVVIRVLMAGLEQ